MERYSTNLTDKQWQVIEKKHQSARKKAKTFSPKHHECPSKFKVIPKRWIVERSFARLEKFRRLTIDYEYHADTAETMVQLAFCKIMLNKFIE